MFSRGKTAIFWVFGFWVGEVGGIIKTVPRSYVVEFFLHLKHDFDATLPDLPLRLKHDCDATLLDVFLHWQHDLEHHVGDASTAPVLGKRHHQHVD